MNSNVNQEGLYSNQVLVGGGVLGFFNGLHIYSSWYMGVKRQSNSLPSLIPFLGNFRLGRQEREK